MRFGKPDVQWDDARLRAESRKGEEKGRRPPGRRLLQVPHVLEGVVAGSSLQHPEAKQDRDGAQVRDQQVEVARAPDFGVAVIGDDEEE